MTDTITLLQHVVNMQKMFFFFLSADRSPQSGRHRCCTVKMSPFHRQGYLIQLLQGSKRLSKVFVTKCHQQITVSSSVIKSIVYSVSFRNGLTANISYRLVIYDRQQL